jgi:hypothetical protein
MHMPATRCRFRTMRSRLIAGALIAFCCASALADSPTLTVDLAWRFLTRSDLEAAYTLLKDNHPAALTEVGDRSFASRLDAAYSKALQRSTTVASLAGYAATMAEFAHGLGDAHIQSGMTAQPRAVDWPGFVVEKRGKEWLVGNDDPAVTGSALAGAVILNCDGRTPQELAGEILPFHANIGVESNVIVNAGWLLIDDGNPFLTRPAKCSFSQGGAQLTLPLNWTRIAYERLRSKYWKPAYGDAGFQVRPVGDGYWIGLRSLSASAQAVIDATVAKIETIRAARYVLLDLRGNGGGDDAYGRALADVLYGKGTVNDVLGPEDNTSGCTSAFRASAGNRDYLAKAAVQFEKEGDTTGARDYSDAVKAISAAMSQGKALTGPVTCTSKPVKHASLSRPLIQIPVLVLTDVACFSSCINTVDFFRRLGAVQIGQTTDADTHYSEVRAERLPSQLSSFTTLQAIMPDMPHDIGPFVPQFEYQADIADSAALEKWVTETVLPKIKRANR